MRSLKAATVGEHIYVAEIYIRIPDKQHGNVVKLSIINVTCLLKKLLM